MVYETCASCHALQPDPDEVYFGPHLRGIIGREVAADPDFQYSEAMLAYGGTWTEERLAAYLRAPEEAIPGTEMIQALPEPQDVADVIAYLRAVQDDSRRER
jgi:cytochrome c